MKIYTRTGDNGETSLASGKRVSKADVQVELYGMVDDLNSRFGFCYALIDSDLQKEFIELQDLQHKLFELGSELAGFETKSKKQAIAEKDIFVLEKSIDVKENFLPDLTDFILPGGHPAAACMHLARTCCRQLERKMIEIQNRKNMQKDFIKEQTIAWINRLSDYCFVMARYINYKTKTSDIKWDKEK